MTLDDIRKATQGRLIVEPSCAANRPATGLSWDSREVTSGDVYLALKGARVDGHDFIVAAIAAGAVGVLVTAQLSAETLIALKDAGVWVLAVNDAMDAIAALACAWRTKLTARVVGITGSSGKTSTKNLVRDVLSSQCSTIATQGNQNNELGVPKTILNATQDTEALVVELGMRGLGQIASLASFVQPDVAVITNIGESHLELLGSRKNIARAKAELLEALPDGLGVAVVNAACPYTPFMCEHAQLRQRGIKIVAYDGSADMYAKTSFDASRQSFEQADDFTLTLKPQVFARNVELDERGYPSFDLCTPQGECRCVLSVQGAHNVHNACAAAAVGLEFGLSLQQIQEALSHTQAEAGRQEIIESPQGFTIINDAYNANPDSMEASLRFFASYAPSRRHIAVLGDMGELGSALQVGHERVGGVAADVVDVLICVGEYSAYLSAGAQSAGMAPSAILCFPDRESATAYLQENLVAGDVVLLKASHALGLERIAERLVK